MTVSAQTLLISERSQPRAVLHALDVAGLPRDLFRDDASATVTWTDRDPLRIGGGRDALTLIYTCGGEEVSERLAVEWTPCNYGGARAWLRCPGCRRRVRKLFAGERFQCRRCVGLVYETKLMPAWERKMERARAIRVRLGGSDDLFAPFPAKPLRMRARTYDRLRGQATELWLDSLRLALRSL